MALRSPATRRLAISMLGTLALGVLSSVPVAAPSPVHLVAAPVASTPWLDRLNSWRASTGLSTLTENPTWSQGDAAHALYMVKNDLVTHYETPGVPYYTTAGDTEARNSNIQVSSSTGTTDVQAIDWWMAAPFHAMAMMDPRLAQTGFGSYRDSSTSPWQEGGALDTIQGNSFSGGSYPVYFPGNGTTEPLTTYGGGEFPDPLQACPGYSAPTGLPVFIQVGGNVNTTAGAVHSFTGNGVALNHCVIDSSNSAVSSYLYTRGGVILVPQQPLQAGVRYVVALTVNGTPYTWSFTVGPFITVSSVSPNVGPPAGGTTVTISGTGFANGLTSVNFGTTSAASFSVVNDTTVTAVSPAHAVSTVDVTVTTATGTSATSSADQFTFSTPCTSAGLSSDKASPQQTGTVVTYTATSATCPNPEYLFYVQAPGGPWVVAQGYGGPTFVWNTAGLAVGTYNVDVWVRQAGTGVAYQAFQLITYTLTIAPACTSAGLSPDKASPQVFGTTVTFTATSATCPNPEYLFYVQAPGGPWVVAQGYGGPTFVWNTAGLAVGTYNVDVWVRQAGTGVAYQAFQLITYTLTIAPACTSAGLSPDKASPQVFGTTVTFTATSATCPNPEYLFYVQAPGGPWVVAQGYGGPTFVWNTAGLAVGTYNVDVWVRQAGTGVAYQAFQLITYTLTTAPACTSAGLSPDKASPQVFGTTVTFTATSATCPNPEYLFYVQAPGGPWVVAQGYGGPTFVWNTAGLGTGTYNVDVWVRQAGNGVAYQAFQLITYTLTTAPACTSAGLSPDKPSPQQVGTIVTFTGSSATCSQPQYLFYVQAPGGSWMVARAYDGPTFVWNTAGLGTGTYNVDVWVRQNGSTAAEEAFQLITFTLTTPLACASAGLSPDKASPQPVGTVVTFTATSSTCSQAQYLFYVKSPSGVWTVAQGYGSPTFVWNTAGLPVGTYAVDVWVRQNGSLAPQETFILINYTLT